MTEHSPERKLAAIVAADVVGYSRLMELDETGTHARLKALREQVVEPQITAYHGRIVKLMGDGILAEFSSVVDALACAVDVQRFVVTRNADVAKDHQINFRIGINLGDIIVEGDDIYGDGVNIAARLEAMAEPGGVYISGTAYDQVRNKLGVGLEALGEHTVKNIADPVRVYRVSLKPVEKQSASGNSRLSWLRISQRTRYGMIAITVMALLAGALWWWQLWIVREEPASVERMAFALPDKPSIAVLPFNNMSSDTEQAYFTDGLTEDLITDLSKLPELFVIARNTSFSYKGKAVKVHQVAEELGVRYVLEGSVRRSGDQLRITAQLIDATSGGHLWAERYDSTVSDVFALQDKINQQIISALQLKLSSKTKASLQYKSTINVEAYEAFLNGLRLLNMNNLWVEVTDTTQAKPEFERAIELDPNYALPYAGLGWVYWNRFGAAKDPALKQSALELAEKSLALAENPLALRLQAKQHISPDFVARNSWFSGQHDQAVALIRQALALAPNDADTMADLAYTLVFAGEAQEASQLMHQAIRLNPNFPAWYHRPAGIAHYFNGQYAQAVREFKAWYESEPVKSISLPWLAAAYAQAGELDEARQVTEEAFLYLGSTYYPKTIQAVRYYYPFKREADIDQLTDGLRKADWPDADDL